jgi:hypothetical protein
MNIALFVSGYPRTLFYKFSDNIKLIKDKVGKCQIDVFYSFWNDLVRFNKINDPWHSFVESYNPEELTKNVLDEYFIECGANKVDGEIESIQLMEKIMEQSPFHYQTSLSSQYYKTYKVVEKYFNLDYDFYVRMRPDITINDFISKDKIYELQNKKTLLVNQYYWYNAPYKGDHVNEMIWASAKDVFFETNSMFLGQNNIEKQRGGEDGCGECNSARYFNSLINSNILTSIESFNFDYRVFR